MKDKNKKDFEVGQTCIGKVEDGTIVVGKIKHDDIHGFWFRPPEPYADVMLSEENSNRIMIIDSFRFGMKEAIRVLCSKALYHLSLKGAFKCQSTKLS